MTVSEVEVRALVQSGAAAYHPDHIPLLEEYLHAFVESANKQPTLPYIFGALRLLVKLYQLFPETRVVANLVLALTVALTHHFGEHESATASSSLGSAQDFVTLSYLIPPPFWHQQPLLRALANCLEYLQACHYPQFWRYYHQTFLLDSSSPNQDSETNAVAPDSSVSAGTSATESEDATFSESSAISVELVSEELRKYCQHSIPTLQRQILQVLALTYREAPRSVVATALNLGSDMVATATSISDSPIGHGIIETITPTSVRFVATADNTPRQKVYEESVNYSTIQSLLRPAGQ